MIDMKWNCHCDWRTMYRQRRYAGTFAALGNALLQSGSLGESESTFPANSCGRIQRIETADTDRV